LRFLKRKVARRECAGDDIGGTHIKVLATGEKEPRKFPSGPKLTVRKMVSGVKEYDVVAIGYPGRDRPITEPHNLASGWVGFNFQTAFQRRVNIINDAAMQALGCYKGGTLLFLGFGTGLGSALVVEGLVVPMELAHLSYRNGTIEDYVGLRGLKRGKKKWRHHVAFAVARLMEALHPDDVVLGGGNAKLLKKLPPGCRTGDNANAFLGGFTLWEEPSDRRSSAGVKPPS
jgi:polyphosphate glucokinase